MLEKGLKRLRRKHKIRTLVSGTKKIPRLAVFRSNTHISAQIIDDEAGKTLCASSDLKIKKDGNKVEMAKKVGEEIAKKAVELKLKKVVFDRGGFAYQGRVQALADSAREAGLQF